MQGTKFVCKLHNPYASQTKLVQPTLILHQLYHELCDTNNHDRKSKRENALQENK